jgi:hypothetical protein
MALFAIWPEEGGGAEARHQLLREAAHVVPERTTAARIETSGGTWRLAAFATATHFYSAEAQVWIDPMHGACVVHGLIWRIGTGRLIDAAGVAALLDCPGKKLPDDVAGEYAIARLHGDGTLEAFGDPAGLYQLFRAADGRPILANRAAFVALIGEMTETGREGGLWLGTIGYRVGTESSWAGVAQLGQRERLIAGSAGSRIERRPFGLVEPRGFAHEGAALVEEGLEQAKAAIRLAAGDGPLDLPITGGKDSRVVLAIALAAGSRDRLTLFTRGYAGHPDVAVAEMIAASIGVPHRREPPLGSDLPADLSPNAFLRLLGTIAWQADGGIGGWDNISGTATGRATIVSGHLGEVLKAYAKRPPSGAPDPATMVRLQAPFDPIDLLRPEARAMLVDRIGERMAAHRAGGAEEADLPDLFYWENRVPNWLGGIRGIKAFERQPVLPLGVPALMDLAFRMRADERKIELAHFKLIEAAAPALIDLPFAHQSWSPLLGGQEVPPVLAVAGAPLFGSWQWSVNRVPAVRAALARLFASVDIPLWQDVDRARLIDALHQRRFDMFDLISLLGFAVAAIHQAGLGVQARLGEPPPEEVALDRFAAVPAPRFAGYVDVVRGAERIGEDGITLPAEGTIGFDGWVHSPDWPGAAPAVELRADGRTIASAGAERHRPDLAAAGIGDGRHAFSFDVATDRLDGAATLMLAAAGSEQALAGGRLAIRDAVPDRSPGPSG